MKAGCLILALTLVGTSSIPLFVHPANKNVILALVEGNGKIKRRKKSFSTFLSLCGRDISYVKRMPACLLSLAW